LQSRFRAQGNEGGYSVIAAAASVRLQLLNTFGSLRLGRFGIKFFSRFLAKCFDTTPAPVIVSSPVTHSSGFLSRLERVGASASFRLAAMVSTGKFSEALPSAGLIRRKASSLPSLCAAAERLVPM
jgi:hypothetical protein